MHESDIFINLHIKFEKIQLKILEYEKFILYLRRVTAVTAFKDTKNRLNTQVESPNKIVKMKRFIKHSMEERKRIARVLGCTPKMVYLALTYRKQTYLARKIRHVALKQFGCVEVVEEIRPLTEDEIWFAQESDSTRSNSLPSQEENHHDDRTA